MKLQVAIDRVNLDKAISLAKRLDGIADIIEFGTSIVKDYGLIEISNRNLKLKKSMLLVDLKTNDEAEYEFNQGFKCGADILTVMGTAGSSTLEIAHKTTKLNHKQMLIDLMGMSLNQIEKLKDYSNTIYNLHNSHDDNERIDVINQVEQFKLKSVEKKLALAGGIDIKQAKRLAKQNLVDIVIVGGKIINSPDPIASAEAFREVIKNERK